MKIPLRRALGLGERVSARDADNWRSKVPILITTTSAEADNWGVAELTIDAKLAKKLLSYRRQYARVKKFDERLYVLEFFDGTVRYGDRFENIDDDLEYGVWVNGGSDPGLLTRYQTAAETMKITDYGVLWAASDKHVGGEFETPELSWEDIELLARGENPFADVGTISPKE
jgi:hypothetical protein